MDSATSRKMKKTVARARSVSVFYQERQLLYNLSTEYFSGILL
jgi:hypothetical protein